VTVPGRPRRRSTQARVARPVNRIAPERKVARTDSIKKTLIYIPLFNDFAAIERIVEEISGVVPSSTILLLDDGSTDGAISAEVAAKCLTIRLPSNYGIGVCTHVAFDHAIAHGYDYICRVDADGQHPIKRMPEMLNMLAKDGVDLVVGARTLTDEFSHVDPILRRMVRAYFSICARLLTGNAALKDVNTGFFAVTGKAAHRFNRYQLERYPEPQLFVRAARMGLRMKLFSVERRDRLYGSSSLGLGSALKMIYRFNVLVLSEVMQRSDG